MNSKLVNFIRFTRGYRNNYLINFNTNINCRWNSNKVERKEYEAEEVENNNVSSSNFSRKLLQLENNNETVIANSNNNVVQFEPDILLDESLTEEQREKIKLMKAEYKVWKYADPDGMPDKVSNDQWETMLELKTVKERIMHLSFIQHRSKVLILQKQLVAERKAARLESLKEKQLEFDKTGHLIYGLAHNNILRRINVPIREYYYKKALLAHCRGPKVVIDMSFINVMSFFEQSLTFGQLRGVININSAHRFPVGITVTSLNRNEKWFPRLEKYFCGDFDNTYAMLTTEKSYLDLFPREKLTYLTPDASDTLTQVDEDRVYIMGAIVDKQTMRPKLTYNKATSQGIETRKLPLDLYLKWKRGSKYLAMCWVLEMLLDFNITNDWYSALQTYCPEEKIVEYTEDEQHERKVFKQNQFERLELLTFLSYDLRKNGTV